MIYQKRLPKDLGYQLCKRTVHHYVMIVSVHTMAGLAARRLRPFWRMHDASDVTRRMWFSV